MSRRLSAPRRLFPFRRAVGGDTRYARRRNRRRRERRGTASVGGEGQRLLRRFFLFCLAREQSPFTVYTPSISSQPAICPDDTVAGHNQRHWIMRAGARDGADRGRLANGVGDLSVRACLPIGNGAQRRPDMRLKGG